MNIVSEKLRRLATVFFGMVHGSIETDTRTCCQEQRIFGGQTLKRWAVCGTRGEVTSFPLFNMIP